LGGLKRPISAAIGRDSPQRGRRWDRRQGSKPGLGYTLGTTFQLHREPAGLSERGVSPREGDIQKPMRRYELMLVMRPDTPDEQVDAVVDRATRSVSATGGQIVKRSPWGRRRLAYPIGQFREGSYHILLFDAPPDAVLEMERGLNISEDVLRHLVTRVERPLSRRGGSGDELELDDDTLAGPPPDIDEEDIPDTEFIDESESEAAPAAVES